MGTEAMKQVNGTEVEIGMPEINLAQDSAAIGDHYLGT
jgi:hypothetical protein